MSVTFSGAFTFTGGGFTASLAPPAQATAGWLGGGSGPRSTVNRITFATDTATASVRGPLSSVKYSLAATGNFTNGWFGGGNIGPTPTSTVQRITYATDTATASVRGPLSSARYLLAAAGNTTDGWFVGGGFPAPGTPAPFSTVDRITYATDNATASVRGPLSVATKRFSAAGLNTDGWFGGGRVPGSPTNISTVQRITYATDTATVSVRGPLSIEICDTASSSDNTTYGWWAGGSNISTVSRITYATDTATASIRGPLSSARGYFTAVGDNSYGWFAGGFSTTSLVDRITYATDTATASVRGPLSSAVYNLAATSGIQ